MAKIKSFKCIRPNIQVVKNVAALPYDVYNREEALEEVRKEPLSFLNIDRAETGFDESVNTYDERVYKRARLLLDQMLENGTFISDNADCFYLYELIMDGRGQTGIVGCASIDDYLDGVIKKHENTREDKEIDRIKHVDACDAQTGPIFLAYRANEIINQTVIKIKKESPLYDFNSDDGIVHKVWRIDNEEDINIIQRAFLNINSIYIADGHHRAASAVKVGLKRRSEKKDYTGDEEFNYFLSVLFPHDELFIMSYNRAVKDLNNYTKENFLDAIQDNFQVENVGKKPYSPNNKSEFGMYLDNEWFKLTPKDNIKDTSDPVKGLDVSILQEYLLDPILGINDPRTDKRIDFIGGIRGLNELERRVNNDMKVAFSVYPTSINELFNVSDANMLMPPKSTWFEPKLRSGLFIHRLN